MITNSSISDVLKSSAKKSKPLSVVYPGVLLDVADHDYYRLQMPIRIWVANVILDITLSMTRHLTKITGLPRPTFERSRLYKAGIRFYKHLSR